MVNGACEECRHAAQACAHDMQHGRGSCSRQAVYRPHLIHLLPCLGRFTLQLCLQLRLFFNVPQEEALPAEDASTMWRAG